MYVLANDELKEIQGGGLTLAGIGAAIVGIVSFIVGIFDGYTRPLKCR